MRDVEFRAWNKVEKIMYTDAINNCKDSFDVILKHPQIYEVMQFTGLKDIKGVKIYEGDIIKYPTIGGKTLTSVIYWDNEFAQWCYGVGFHLRKGEPITKEVIGNIYEPPNHPYFRVI